MLVTNPTFFEFELPQTLTQPLPTEERGIERDQVRLMVSKLMTDSVFHTTFTHIDRFLRAGDVLVINTSATMPAALDITLTTGQQGRLHLSTHLDGNRWLAELRQVVKGIPKRFFLARTGDELRLPGNGEVQLLYPYYETGRDESPSAFGISQKGRLQVKERTGRLKDHLHLWEIELRLPAPLSDYLQHFGKPIRYDNRQYPLAYYQTVFATQAGSAEMPSAGRAFTHPLITRLLAKGVQFAPITLHTGVSSLEVAERPYPEYFQIPEASASLLNLAQREGRRIIAVGTTAVRALESAVNENGEVEVRHGWTDLYITPERGMRIVNGLLTGLHEPRASHLHMLEALAGSAHLEIAYREAIEKGYLWHEFGDLHLML
ncbi:MAG: S-adenosylmethionine:tRNA ribosyltransferase-isomerase [Saprospiraceae bacterium]|nr:S-adenosylmethionine:tRNA ribosyltransferase-isomerase [Lewinella sp.]